jgi:signal transduction histidine kinase
MAAPSLELQLAAARKTVAALMRRVEEEVSSGNSAFGVLQQNIVLERVVQEKTREVEAKRQELQAALTNLQKAQTELMQAQKLESVGRLASGVAHEINTPIQFVGDHVQFVQEAFADVARILDLYRQPPAGGDATPEAVAGRERLRAAEVEVDLDYLLANVPQALRSAREGIERVATIVRSLKEFAHPEQKEQAPADLNRALATTLAIARNEYKYVATVETDYGELPPVTCHLGELNQVFLNLIVNAAHAIEELGGEGLGLIKIASRHEGDCVHVTISDTGGGIPPGVRERVFDPFFTTKPVGKGTGQGLAIARSVVLKHRGDLRFDTEVGQGTVFHLRLPIAGSSAERVSS